MFGPERWYRSGAYGSLIRVIHTLYEYAENLALGVQGRRRAGFRHTHFPELSYTRQGAMG